jgi:hypothetical protein
VRVFGDRLDRDPADFLQRSAANDRARTAEESRVPEVVPVLHQSVKQLTLIGNAPKLTEVPLKGIRRIEMMRRLKQAKPVVLQEPPHRYLQE